MESNNNQNNNGDVSFLEEGNGPSINIKDIIGIILRNLHWLILFAALGGAAAFYWVQTQPVLYSSGTTFLLRNNSRSNGDGLRESATISSLQKNIIVSSNIENEMMIIRSKNTMREVASRLNLDVSYYGKTKLTKRTKDLYKMSPFTVSFPEDTPSQPFSFSITPVNDTMAEIFISEDVPLKQVAFNKTFYLPFCAVVIEPNALADFNDKDIYKSSVEVVYRPIDMVADIYRSKIQLSRDDQRNSILHMRIVDTSPIRARDILAVVIEVYNEDAVNEKKAIIAETDKYIQARLNELGSELGNMEREMADFKKDNLLLDVSEYGQSYIKSTIAYSEEIVQIESQLSRARYLKEFIEQDDGTGLIPTNFTADIKSVGELVSQYNNNILEIRRYEKSGATRNPVVLEMKSTQLALKDNMLLLINDYINSTKPKLKVAKQKESESVVGMQEAPEKQLHITSLERVQKIKEALYINLLTKREEMYLDRPSTGTNAKIIDPPYINSSPVSPKKSKTMTMGVLLGLLVPVAFYFIARLFDTAVHNKKDIEKYTAMPFLGEIPERDRNDKRNVVVTENGRDSISEAFRVIRANLDYVSHGENEKNVIMFTSFYPGSGKTFISINMAASFAYTAKKTILVDLDIRKGTLAKNFDHSAVVGVTNYLSGRVTDIDSLIVKSNISDNLDLLFSGPIPPNPSELLSNKRLDELVGYLKEKYDYVFLDNVPFGIVADSAIVSHTANVTIFVVRANITDKRMIPDLDNLYKSKRFNNMVLILNSVRFKKKKAYGGYGHYGYGRYGYGGYGFYGYGGYGGYGYGYGGYGYGYGYGYGSEDETKPDSKFYKTIFKLIRKNKDNDD